MCLLGVYYMVESAEFDCILDEVGLVLRVVVKVQSAPRRVALVEGQGVVLAFSLVVEEGKM